MSDYCENKSVHPPCDCVGGCKPKVATKDLETLMREVKPVLDEFVSDVTLAVKKLASSLDAGSNQASFEALALYEQQTYAAFVNGRVMKAFEDLDSVVNG